MQLTAASGQKPVVYRFITGAVHSIKIAKKQRTDKVQESKNVANESRS